jgi:prolipoprotein diacylglyceryltransferase
MGVFCLYYGITRGLTDFLRVNDKTVAGLTGAQWMCLCLVPTGIWILTRVRRALAGEPAAIEVAALLEPSDGEPLEPTS